MKDRIKYRLIKEYPNSRKIGSVFEFNDHYGTYECDDCINSSWNEEYFRKWIGIYYEIYYNEETKSQESLNEELSVADIINRLFELQRVDIDPQYNGEYFEIDLRPEENGRFVEWREVRKLISQIRTSNKL